MLALKAALLLLPASCTAVSTSSRHGTLRVSPNVSALPGLCDTVPQTAGYFDISGTKNAHYFYWSFAARSGKADAPTILWMTGGPGCSSGIALFHENGPCKINSDHKTTSLNPWSWNDEANIVFIDQPAGVGFSYGDSGDEAHDEAGVAKDMVAFLEAYSAANNDVLKRNEFFIFGESYGGHYAPATAAAVVETSDLNLVGLGVGNGLTDPAVQYPKYGEMAYNWSIAVQGHPTISLAAYEAMEEEVPACVASIEACQADTSKCAESQNVCNNAQIGPYEQTGLNPYDIRVKCAVPPLCYDFSDVEDFLDLPTTRAALGVSETTPWQSCNYTVNGMVRASSSQCSVENTRFFFFFFFAASRFYPTPFAVTKSDNISLPLLMMTQFANDWMKTMKTHVSDVLAKGVRVLIYAGDVDFICNWLGNKAWTLALDFPGHAAFNAEGDHNSTTVSGTTARSSGNFTFLQVHAAGHMVPLDQPQVAQEMVNNFLTNGKWY